MKISLIALLLSAIFVATGCGRTPTRSPEMALTELQHLASLRCEFTIVSIVEHTDLGGTDKALRRMNGSILLSYDLGKSEIHREEDKITITLPEMDLLSPKIDSDWETISERRSLYTSETTYNRYLDEADKEAQQKIVEKAKDPQIVALAKESCSKLIKEFYKSNFGLEAIVK